MRASGLVKLFSAACIAALAAWFCGMAAAQDAPARVKSWIYVDHSCAARVLTEGDPLEVPVEYYLDPAEDEGGTSLTLWGGGPFIDVPDGKYTKERHHVSYPGLWAQVEVKPGRGRHVFRFTVPPALPQNAILFVAGFRDASGKSRPWDARRGRVWFVRKGGFFELETGKPGNLFTYDEPVRIVARLKAAAATGEQKALGYTVTDTTGTVVARGRVPFGAQAEGQQVPVDLALDRRGTFLFEADVPGWEKRETTFCRIPDLMAITGGAPTRFGMTNVVEPGPPARIDEECRVARMLGLTSCRSMFTWQDMEPGPGVYTLDPWEQAFEIGRRNGIDSWLCVYGPPPWACVSPAEGHYSAVRVDWDAWRDYVHTASTRLKGRFYGWEWLNEITPGGTEDPVADYLTMCRIGTDTAHAVDPDLVTILAGGLWPRSYRIEMLKAGVADYVDVLPIHYSNGAGVQEARADLRAVGAQHVAVWDDESGRGLNAWDVPPLEELQNTTQSRWVMTHWTDELAAGCERIIYFGGTGAPAGNWTYLLGDLRPRPLAATLAVFTAKMFRAEPVGVFPIGKAGLCHLFERDGAAVLVCSTGGRAETVALPVGADFLQLTDHQGNERTVAAPDNVATLDLADMPYFVEGANLDALKAQVVARVLPNEGAAGTPPTAEPPRLTMLAGRTGSVPVRLRNPYDSPLEGSVRLELPPGWPPATPVPFTLAPAEERLLPAAAAAPADAAAGDQPGRVRVAFARADLPEVVRPFAVAALSPNMLGNLVRNGGFERPDEVGTGPEGWRVNGKTSRWVEADGISLGLGARALRFAESPDTWASTGQTLNLPGGRTYLYTTWIWNHDMGAGSNVYLNKADGTRDALYDNQVFRASESTPCWQLYTSRIRTPANLASAGFSPLARGPGWALFDNVRVTLFEGTDFVAECRRAPGAPRTDGQLDEWVRDCPIPLIGRNQLTVARDGYDWSPANLSGVAYLMHDDANLYLAIEVRDDVHAPATDEATATGDGFQLAFSPAGRAPEAAAKAFELDVSSAAPGGGSGAHTIYRPAAHAGGLSTGHLFRDSSVYEMAIARSEGCCVYELRIPLSELGGPSTAPGAKLGLSIQLNDNDGAGLAAHMNWGGGLSPAWQPEDFGIVTFVE